MVQKISRARHELQIQQWEEEYGTIRIGCEAIPAESKENS